jgi:uncharacterized protein
VGVLSDLVLSEFALFLKSIFVMPDLQVYLPIADMPVNLFLIVALGAAVGFLSGLFGVGGGFLLTPLLILLNIPPAVAVATQAPQIAASSTTSVLAAWRNRALDLQLGGFLLIGGLLGTVLGILVFRNLKRLGQLDLAIALSYVTLLGIVGLLMLVDCWRIFRSKKRIEPAKATLAKPVWHAALPLQYTFVHSGLRLSLIPLFVLSFFIGFAGAVMGIGGGFILIPALLYFFRASSSTAIAVSQFQILFTMIVATIMHAVINQTVDILLALMLIVGGVFGAQFGTRAGRNLKTESFKLLLALLVLSVSLRFAFDLTITPKEFFSIAERR